MTRNTRTARLLGTIGGAIGFMVALAIVSVATGTGETPYAYLDAAIVGACGALGIWGAWSAGRDVRRASVTMLATGLVGFFFVGIVWIVAGALLIAGAIVARREFS